jgi:uncharacterized protein (TIGR03437 family)
VRLLLALLTGIALFGQCTFVLNPSSVSAPAVSETVGSFTVTASNRTCERTAVSTNPEWLSISFGQSGTGNGTVGYRIPVNPTPIVRTGAIMIGSARFTVTQAAGSCAFELSAVAARVTAAAGSGSFRVETRCQWTAQSNVAWLRVTSASSGTGDSTVSFSYDQNTAQETRTGQISIGGRTYTVTQNGVGCTVRLGSAAVTVPASGGAGSVDVVANCTWSATRSQTWITLTGALAANGNGSVPYRVESHMGAARRFGTINVQDQIFTITQEASDLPQISEVLNAGSLLPGPIAGGEIVVLKGNRFGPEAIAVTEPTDGFLPKEAAGTRVYFDDVPAPMLYAVSGQVAAIVPYAIAGRTRSQAVVEYAGKRSAPFGADVAATAPGLLTQSATGSGPGSIVNQDGTVNGILNPAARGSIVQIYATGGGETEPRAEDGKLVAEPFPELTAPALVFIGGALAELLYKGETPTVTAGLDVFIVRVPMAAPPGDFVPVQIRVGARNTQGSVTASIQ